MACHNVLKCLPRLVSSTKVGYRHVRPPSSLKPCAGYHGDASGSRVGGGVADHVVDLRSDTVTTPSAEMRRAMAAAPVGDDVIGEDPTVKELEAKATRLFGTEAALFVPTGTMGNLIAIMSHCTSRDHEAFVGDLSHINLWEQGGIAQLASVHPRVVSTLADGSLSLEEVESKLRIDDPHFPVSRLLCLENSHNYRGGVALPLQFLKQTRELCERHGLLLHLDGARVLNAATYLGCEAADITRHCHSVTMCLSKGLGAPVGSLLGGTKDFIYRAVRARKVLGGGWRQAGVLAACGLVALSQGAARLGEDHANARIIAEGISELETPNFEVNLERQHTNIVNMHLGRAAPRAAAFVARLAAVGAEEEAALGARVVVRAWPGGSPSFIRFVTHCDVTTLDTQRALAKILFVMREFDDKL